MNFAIRPRLPLYNRARYYDPTSGRFLKEDPIRFAAGANFYSYTQNSPTSFADPTGLAPDCALANCVPRDGLALPLRLQLYLMGQASKLTGVTYYFGLQGSYTRSKGGFGYSITGGLGFATDPQGNTAAIVSGGTAGTLGTPGFGGGFQVGAATFSSVYGFGGNSYGAEASGGEGLIVGGGYCTNSSGLFTYANVGVALGKNVNVSPKALSNGLKVVLICP